jgi:hypothetical protein
MSFFFFKLSHFCGQLMKGRKHKETATRKIERKKRRRRRRRKEKQKETIS